MSPIAIEKTSTSRLSTFAGVAIALTLGIVFTRSAVPAKTPSQAATTITAPKASGSPSQPRRHWYQLGSASWYGKYFQGQPTASGEAYDMNNLTCAHRTLPLGSLIRVTNLRNHKTVVVRVNDRGPMLEDRIIDLSYAAASFLGVRGTAKVRLELLPASTVARLDWPATPGE